jgi:hypothetical protein
VKLIALAITGLVLASGIVAAPAQATTTQAWGPAYWSTHKHCTTTGGTDLNFQVQYREDDTGLVQQLGVAIYGNFFVWKLSEKTSTTVPSYSIYSWTINGVAQPAGFVRYNALPSQRYKTTAQDVSLAALVVGDEVGDGNSHLRACNAYWVVNRTTGELA